jgi:hypothetical protein
VLEKTRTKSACFQGFSRTALEKSILGTFRDLDSDFPVIYTRRLSDFIFAETHRPRKCRYHLGTIAIRRDNAASNEIPKKQGPKARRE